MSYYNTIPETGAELEKSRSKAESQKKIIFGYYKSLHFLTPSLALKISEGLGKKWPITSIRRAISDLEKEGLLIKNGEKSMGPYGKMENRWILKTNQLKLF